MSLVLQETVDGVRILRLNRPEQRNALNAEIREALIRAVQEADADEAIGAIVVTGEGPCFAAGADVRELLARSKDEQRTFISPPHIYSAIQGASKPVLAAINGHALGAGLELATACDVRIAATKAKLGQPEIHLGLIPGGGGTQRLVHLVGHGHASRLVLSGAAVSAEEAQAIGLVDVVTDDAEQAAVELAQQIASHDRAAVGAAKRALAAAVDMTPGLGVEIDEFVALHGEQAAVSRIEAFLNRK